MSSSAFRLGYICLSFLIRLIFDVKTALCPDPGVPNQGIRLGDSFQDGKEVTFNCNRNHDLLGNEKIRCNGGVWSSTKPRCKGNDEKNRNSY